MLKRVNNFFLRSGQILKSIRCFSSTTTNKEERAASFENYLKSKIKMHGPLTVADYMKEALSNPVWVRALIPTLTNLLFKVNCISFFFFK